MRKIILFLFISILLVACGKETNDVQNEAEKPQIEPKVESSEEEVAEDPVEPEYENIYPLTGIGTNDPIDNRIVAVMVNNHSKARPQKGLTKADVVFEILAEGMITRFLALYQSEQPEIIGPVRSARDYFYDLADRYGAIYVHHGGSPGAYALLANDGVANLDGMVYDNDGKLFKRGSLRVPPHNSYLLFDNVYNVAENLGYDITADYEPLPFLSKDEMDALDGEPANYVEIVYSNNPMEIVEFKYDTATEKYTRFNDREMTVELETGEPIQVDNIFIIETHHEVIDDVGRRAVDLYSGGDAILIHKGKAQKLTWENRDGRIVPVKDGKVIGFVPGKTWINVIPTSPGIEKSVTITGE